MISKFQFLNGTDGMWNFESLESTVAKCGFSVSAFHVSDSDVLWKVKVLIFLRNYIFCANNFRFNLEHLLYSISTKYQLKPPNMVAFATWKLFCLFSKCNITSDFLDKNPFWIRDKISTETRRTFLKRLHSKNS